MSTAQHTPSLSKRTPMSFTVGDRVLVRLADTEEPEIGSVVEDYQELVSIHPTDATAVEAAFGRAWGLLKRYAVALESGTLVFRDTHELKPWRSAGAAPQAT